MLRPTMLRLVGQQCCERLHGPLRNCTRDIPRHRQLHGLSRDNVLDSECKLLLARAGKAPVFLDVISKINSHMHILSST